MPDINLQKKFAFPKTTLHLENARVGYNNMFKAIQEDNMMAFREAFSSTVKSIVGVRETIDNECQDDKKMVEWWHNRRTEWGKDGLMDFFYHERKNDFHHGEHTLKFGFKIIGQAIPDASKRPPGSRFQGGPDGFFYVVNQGTPQEKRIPAPYYYGSKEIFISISNPPRSHLGQALTKDDPISLIELGIKYVEQLLYDAKEAKFG